MYLLKNMFNLNSDSLYKGISRKLKLEYLFYILKYTRKVYKSVFILKVITMKEKNS